MKNKRGNVLITGADGQLGNEMRTLCGFYPHYNYFFTDVETLDITNKEAVLEYVTGNNINFIVNCAAYTAVDKAEDDEERADMINHIAVGYLAEAAKKNKARLIHISTDYVFNGKNFIPYREDAPTSPTSVYGVTKLKGEQIARAICYNTVIIRTSWLYSSFGDNFVKTMIRLGNSVHAVRVVFDQIGTPTYARDLANVIFQIMDEGMASGIYHYSNEGICSWYDFAKAIHRLAGVKDCEIKPIYTVAYPTKAKRPAYSVLNKNKIKRNLDIEIPHWEDSLRDCIRLLLV